MKTKKIPCFLIITVLLALFYIDARSIQVPTYSPEEAINHIGEYAAVVGKVTQVYFSKEKNTVFFYIGGRFPDHPFAAVILPAHLKKFPPVDKLKEKFETRLVKVTGTIKKMENNDKSEVFLSSPLQLIRK